MMICRVRPVAQAVLLIAGLSRNRCKRNREAMRCRTRDTIFEIILEIPDSNPNMTRIGRVSDEAQVGIRQ